MRAFLEPEVFEGGVLIRPVGGGDGVQESLFEP